MPAIGSAGALTRTNGNFVDVTDFGAVANVSIDSSDAFQAALDYLAERGGGTLYVPACSKSPHCYFLGKPVFYNGDNLHVRGDGKHATIIQTWGPAFVIGKHPRFWTSAVTSYEDPETEETVNTRDENGLFVFDGRYLTDLYRLRPQGDIGSGESDEPELDFSVDYPELHYGLRTRGIVKGTFGGNPLATGNATSAPGNNLEGWECHKHATFNFIYFAHDGKVTGGIAGTGEPAKPDPWLLFGNGTDFIFSLAVTNRQLIDRGLVWVKFPQPETTGLHRISVQVDFENERFTVFFDREQIAHTVEFPSYQGYENIQSELFSTFDRIARWETSDFTIGSMTRTSGRNVEDNTVVSDYTIVGVSAFAELLFSHGTNGQPQTRIDAAAVTDSNTTMASDYVSQNAIGCLTIRDASDVHLKTTTIGNGQCYGMATPNGTDFMGGPTAVHKAGLFNLSIYGYPTYAHGNAITLGTNLHCDIADVAVPEGFYSSVGSLDLYVSYEMSITDCDFYSTGAALALWNHGWTVAHNIRFGYIGRCAIRLSGSGLYLRGGMTNDFLDFSEGFLFFFAGKSIGAGLIIEDFLINIEGLRFSPRVAHFYVQKCFYHSNNKVLLRNVTCGTTSSIPAIYVDDPIILEWSNYPSDIRVESCSLPGDGTMVKTRGKDWRGTVELTRSNCYDEIIEIVESLHDYTNLKTVHRDFCSTPNSGGWHPGVHDIRMLNPPPGGAVRWNCIGGGTEGSVGPPIWEAAEVRYSSNKNALAGIILSSMYVDVAAYHPTADVTVYLYMSLLRDGAAETILQMILTGNGTLDRNDLRIRYDYFLPYSTSAGPAAPIAQSSLLANDSTTWEQSVSGVKANKNEIVLTGLHESSPESIITRRAGFGIDIGNASLSTVFNGKTEYASRAFFADADLVIGEGNLQIKHSERASTWSHTMQNKILDWLFGYPSQTFPNTFYVGLSSTQIDPDGTGLTELSGTNYARVPVTRSSDNFKKLGDHGYVWCNKTAIEFGSPETDWGTAAWFFLADAATDGNILAAGRLLRSVSIGGGENPPVFYPEALHIQI